VGSEGVSLSPRPACPTHAPEGRALFLASVAFRARKAASETKGGRTRERRKRDKTTTRSAGQDQSTSLPENDLRASATGAASRRPPVVAEAHVPQQGARALPALGVWRLRRERPRRLASSRARVPSRGGRRAWEREDRAFLPGAATTRRPPLRPTPPYPAGLGAGLSRPQARASVALVSGARHRRQRGCTRGPARRGRARAR
jgi:hypothetical protein